MLLKGFKKRSHVFFKSDYYFNNFIITACAQVSPRAGTKFELVEFDAESRIILVVIWFVTKILKILKCKKETIFSFKISPMNSHK